MTRGRWRCPGPLCGDLQGYQRGCRLGPCADAETVHRSGQRRDQAPTDRHTPITAQVKTAVLDALRTRRPFSAAAATVEVSEWRLNRAREADPAWDEQVRALLRGWPGKTTAQDAASYLDALRAGHGVHAAAKVIGREYTSIYYRRLNDPEFDQAVVDTALAAIPPGRPGPRPRSVHRLNRDDGTER